MEAIIEEELVSSGEASMIDLLMFFYSIIEKSKNYNEMVINRNEKIE